jgi:hypothetical protein
MAEGFRAARGALAMLEFLPDTGDGKQAAASKAGSDGFSKVPDDLNIVWQVILRQDWTVSLMEINV